MTADIEILEERIAQLRETIARDRRLGTGARWLTGAGMAALILMLVTAIPATATVLTGAIAAAIGGVVLMGSNRSTLEQKQAELHALEAARNGIIDALPLRPVAERPTLH